MTRRHSDHFDGRRFFNPGGLNGRGFHELPRMLLTKRTPWPRTVRVIPHRPPAPQGPQDVIVTFIGHSTFLVQSGYHNILTDPMYSERAGPLPFVGPRRARAPGVRLTDLPEISVVLVSHNHYDHCDRRSIAEIERYHRPKVVAPLRNKRLLKSAGARRIEELDWWQAAATTPMPITLTPAQHFSARGPFDRNRALWGGFVITVAERRIYFAGDTGYGPHFKEIRQRAGQIDLALLPIGAYEPRWFMKDIHMNPSEAVKAHLDLGARQSVAMHFGTFQLTPEGIGEPVAGLDAALRAEGIEEGCFRVLEAGESLKLT